ncbi:MAG: hypothetical protein OHK0038_10180 [Flammeovirgaceae bacterium]
MAKKKNTSSELDAFLKAQNPENKTQASTPASDFQENSKDDFLTEKTLSLLQQEKSKESYEFKNQLQTHAEIVESYKELLKIIQDFAQKRKLSPEIVLLNLSELLEKESGKKTNFQNEMPSLIEYIEQNVGTLFKFLLK